MTHVTSLQISDGHADVALACGHTQHLSGQVRSMPRPGAAYDCPDCLFEQFTSAELARLKFWRWARNEMGFAFAIEEIAS